MKLVSWNVNGIRACITKGFYDVLKESKADIFCVQETKMQEGQIELEKHGYYTYMKLVSKNMTMKAALLRLSMKILFSQLLYS